MTDADRVVLDMLAPWDHMSTALPRMLHAWRRAVLLRSTTTQLARTVSALREQGNFAEPAAWETLQRGWHVDGLAVRPEHRMVGHTGFLVTARRLADGVTAPPRRRRPSKGAEARGGRDGRGGDDAGAGIPAYDDASDGGRFAAKTVR